MDNISYPEGYWEPIFVDEKDVPLDGEVDMAGVLEDGSEYRIAYRGFGEYCVILTIPVDDDTEVETFEFHGTLNECKNYVFWELDVV